MSKGYIYILTNPSFPEYVKIGYADDIAKRLKELNRSECIPYAFRAYAIYEVEERLSDVAIHKMIDQINPTLRTVETFDGRKRKKEFYAMSAEDAYAIFDTIAKLGGTSRRLCKVTPEGHEIVDERNAATVESASVYAEEMHLEHGSQHIKDLYLKLKTELVKFGDVIVEPKKLYIAFKSPKNFIDIEIQKSGLKMFLNLKKGSLKDPNDVADDVSNIGHWGNGDYRIYLDDDSNLDYVLMLIKQSYNAQKSDE